MYVIVTQIIFQPFSLKSESLIRHLFESIYKESIYKQLNFPLNYKPYKDELGRLTYQPADPTDLTTF